MASKKISQLDAVTSLDGTETIPVVQGSRTKSAILDDIRPMKRTAAEIAASVTPVDYRYPEGYILRYGANTVPETTDMAPALQAAVDVAVAGGTKRITIPTGRYLLASPVSPASEIFGLQIYGEGMLGTILTASHSDGPVLTLNRSNSHVVGLTLNATTARKNGSATASGSSWANNVGLLFEPADLPSKAVASCVVDDVRCINQPSHGFVTIAANQISRYDNLLVQDNLGHGAVFDNGTLTGRTNKGSPGIVTLTNFWAIGNAGHGAVGGNPNDTVGTGAFRFTFLNAEFDRNATDSNITHSNDQAWWWGENVVWIDSAWAGQEVTGGMRFGGTDLTIINPRFVSCVHSLSLGPDPVNDRCIGVKVENMRVLNTTQDPAIIIEDTSKVYDVKASAATIGNITSRFTAGAVRCTMTLGHSEPITIRQKPVNQTVNNSSTLVNDDDLAIPLRVSESITFQASIRYDGSDTADIQLAFAAPTGATVRWQPEGSIYINTSDAIAAKNGDVGEGTALQFGCASVGTRVVSVIGYVVMSTTAGSLQLQWAQNVADVSDTRVLAGSTLTVIRDNY